MGVKILNEDGSLLHEFRDGLGVPLLYRVLAVAKFTGEDQPEIILNDHVSAFFKAVASASPPSRIRAPAPVQFNDFDPAVRVRISTVFRHAVLNGSLKWLSWSDAEKRAFVTDVLFAPWTLAADAVGDFMEEEDAYFRRIRAALDSQ